VERSIRGGTGADRAGVFGRWREVGAAAAAALLILATLGWWFGHRRGDAARPVGIAETSPVVPGPSAGQPALESKAQTTALPLSVDRTLPATRSPRHEERMPAALTGGPAWPEPEWAPDALSTPAIVAQDIVPRPIMVEAQTVEALPTLEAVQ
jgi:hypothetical protein